MIADLAQVILIASSDSGDSGSGQLALLLSGPAAGAAFFWGVFRYYRNTDKSHDFEHETAIAPTSEITGSDTKIDHVQGVRNSSISGDNVGSYRTRVHRLP